MSNSSTLHFNDSDTHHRLESLEDAQLDALDFGVIGFDRDGIVRRYNQLECDMTGLLAERVVGQPLFTVVAPCMNNFLVAQRFADADDSHSILDTTIDYVFTLRMKPTKVKLRLLSSPALSSRYVLVNRSR